MKIIYINIRKKLVVSELMLRKHLANMYHGVTLNHWHQHRKCFKSTSVLHLITT